MAAASLESPLADVGLSPNARSALDRAGITLVRDLLARAPKRLAHLRGAGSKTRKDIVDIAALLRARLPEAFSTPEVDSEPQVDADLPEAFSVDALVVQRLPEKIRKDAATEPRLLRLTLGIEPPVRVRADAWPAQNDIARELGISQPQVSRTLSKARERWLRNRNVTRVRGEIQETLRLSGGVLSASELESFVLAARGLAEEEPTRTRRSRAVVRAAWEAERGLKETRWVMHRSGDRILLALLKVEASLTAADGSPLLLTWPGLLVRYDRLRDRHTGPAAGTDWALIPADDQSEPPVLDGPPSPSSARPCTPGSRTRGWRRQKQRSREPDYV